MTNPLIGDAVHLAKQGCAVFPCKRNKTPYTANGFKDASTSPEIIERMFARFPDATIGLATGNGLVVIDTDLDPEQGKNGEQELIHLPPLPETFKVRTPRGGYHRYYKIPDAMVLPCSSNRLRPGIDVRADGGYVIAAPSETERGKYEVVDSRTMATIPDSWIELIRPQPKKVEAASFTPIITTLSITPWDDFKMRTSWDEVLTPHGWIRGKTQRGNTHWTRPGKGEGTSATTQGEDGPFYVFSTSTEFNAGEAYSKHYVYAALNHGGDLRQAARALQAKGFGNNGNGALDISHHKPPVELIKEIITDYWTIDKLRGYKVDPAHYLVGDGWMRKQAVTLMVGMTGIGKSVLATQFCASLAVGRDILGKLSVPRPMEVVMIQAENDPDTMKRDLCAITDALNLDVDLLDHNLRIYHKPGMTPMMLGAMLKEIRQEYPFKMVAIDNYMSYCGGDINSTETFFEFRGAIEPVLHEVEAGCLLLTHPPKPMRDGHGQRHAREYVYNAAGTSALANWVRTSCELSLAGQEDARCILRFSKNAERTGLRDEHSGHVLRKVYLERSDIARPYWRISDNQGEVATGQYDEALEQIWRENPLLSIREAALKAGCSKSVAGEVYKKIKSTGFTTAGTPYNDD